MVLPFCSPHSPVCPILLKIFLHHLLDFIPLDFLPLQGAGGPGQRPGECGRRIAGRDACPTQMGGHSPQRSVSALPLPGASLGPQSDCPHCGHMWLKFIPLLPFALQSTPLGCPYLGHFAEHNRLRKSAEQRAKAPCGGRVNRPSLPASMSALPPQISG